MPNIDRIRQSNPSIVISDIHLDSRSSPIPLQYLLQKKREGFTIIGNGDIIDTHTEGLERVLASPIGQMVQEIFDYQTSGNHDIDASPTDLLILESSGVPYHIQHGHQYLKDSKWSQTQLAPELNRAYNDAMDYLMRQPTILAVFRVLSLRKANEKVVQRMRRTLQVPHSTPLVFGHTHLPQIMEDRNATNTGRASPRIIQYGIIQDGKISNVEETL